MTLTGEERTLLSGFEKVAGSAWVAEWCPRTFDGIGDYFTLEDVAESIGITRWRARDLAASLTKKGRLVGWMADGCSRWRLSKDDED